MGSRFSSKRIRWNEWNLEHIAEHGVTWEEVQSIIRNARTPFPEARRDGKYAVWGRGSGGRLLQVIFIVDPDEEIYPIHARPLTSSEKKRLPKGI